jgi:P pilus assembly chaperone PapD
MKKKLFVLLLFFSYLKAVVLYPFYGTIDSKRVRNKLFTISNPTKEPVAVEFSVLRLLDTDGNKEKRVKTQDVSYYPSQFVLAPGKSRNVRVRYNKSTLPSTEEVYRVIAKELDVDVTDRVDDAPKGKIKATVKFRFSYEGLLFVNNGKVQPNLTINSFKQIGRTLEIVVANTGTKSDVLTPNKYNILVTVNGKEYLLTPEDLKKAEFRRTLPGKTNRYRLRYIKHLPYGKITAVRLERKK